MKARGPDLAAGFGLQFLNFDYNHFWGWRILDIEAIRKYCLSLPRVTEHIQWGEDLVFKVGGKMFAVLNLTPGEVTNRISFKCSPEDFAELTEWNGVIPAPYLARAQWVALKSFDVMRSKDLEARINNAYTIIYEKLPLKTKKQLEAGANKSPRK